ncbi:HIT domain-containing protein [Candidatus Woesearchaeota archaeon]|nr:HIT domain-containing protein [Candidatus Woesearchaeota archaeon]
MSLYNSKKIETFKYWRIIIEYMQPQADQNCPFCMISSGKIPAKEVYSDDRVKAVLDINPAAKGHVIIFPKNHYPIMPTIPPDEFKHLAKAAFEISKSVRSSIVSPTNKIFIANGAAAGQQSSHFLIHIIPSDTLVNFELENNQEKDTNIYQALKKNLNIMLTNHYKRENVQNQLISTEHLLETDKLRAKIPEKISAKGHIKIIPKKKIDDNNSLQEIFYLASYAATAGFEYLNAEGTNILMDECHGEIISADILPRFSNDGVNFQWTPVGLAEHELDSIKNMIFKNAMTIDIQKKQSSANFNNPKKKFCFEEFKKSIISTDETFISRKLRRIEN